MKKLKCYSSLLVFALVFSLISCSNETSTAGDSVVKTYDYIKNQEFEKVSKMYVSKEGEELTENEAKMLEGFCAMAFEQHKKKDGVKNIEIVEEKIAEDDSSAKVKFTIHFNNGDTENRSVNLLKKNGKWVSKV